MYLIFIASCKKRRTSLKLGFEAKIGVSIGITLVVNFYLTFVGTNVRTLTFS